MLPFVSIIVITRNNAETIEKCIASLLNQTYPKEKYEVIFVDGHSNDGTDKAIAKHAEHNPSLGLYYEDYGTMGYARNLGIEKSKGEIIAFTDGDAFVPESWLERIVNAFVDGTLAAIGGFDILVSSKESSRIIDSWRRTKNAAGVKAIPCIKTVNFAIRRDALLSCGGFDPSLSHWDEAELMARLSKADIGNILYDPEIVVYHMRSRPSGFSTRIKRVFRKSLSGTSVLMRNHMMRVAVANPASNLGTSFFMILAVVVGIPLLLFSVAVGLLMNILFLGLVSYLIVLSLYLAEMFRRTRRVDFRVPLLLAVDGVAQFLGTFCGLLKWLLQSVATKRATNVKKIQHIR